MSSLARFVALYKHKMFIRGATRGNSFDQWEMKGGRALAAAIVGELAPEAAPAFDFDASTNALIRRHRTRRGRR